MLRKRYYTIVVLILLIGFFSCKDDNPSNDPPKDNTGTPTFEFSSPLEDTLHKGIGNNIDFTFTANSSVSTHQFLSRIKILINSFTLMDSTLMDFTNSIQIDYSYTLSDTLNIGTKYYIDVIAIDRANFDSEKTFVLIVN